tara:strand:- start:44081 stop:44275 length:195 start_codon:yes stop_codon:yes gene_type:complete
MQFLTGGFCLYSSIDAAQMAWKSTNSFKTLNQRQMQIRFAHHAFKNKWEPETGSSVYQKSGDFQ